MAKLFDFRRLDETSAIGISRSRIAHSLRSRGASFCKLALLANKS
jgi:hypothetical protein